MASLKNKTQISTDGVCVYVESRVGAPGFAKLILISLNLLVFTLIIFLLNNVSEQKIGQILLAVGFILILSIFTLTRYTLWNIWGQEFIIINTKSISYQYHYGIFQTNLQTLTFNILGTDYEFIRYFQGIPHGKILFYNYDEKHIPQHLFSSTILLGETEIKKIDELIGTLFVKDFIRENKFIPFSMN